MNKFIHLVILFKEKNHFSTSCYEAKLTRKMLVTRVNGSAACICLLCRGTSQTPRNTFKKKKTKSSPSCYRHAQRELYVQKLQRHLILPSVNHEPLFPLSLSSAFLPSNHFPLPILRNKVADWCCT